MNCSLASSIGGTFKNKASINASSSMANFWYPTILISITFIFTCTMNAFTIASINEAFWTFTCNRSQRWKIVFYDTLLRSNARVANNARILASFSHASHLRRTIFINPAFRFLKFNGWKIRGNMHSKSDSVLVHLLALTFYTSCITISFKWESTRTRLSMIASWTISSQGAVSWITKWLTFFSCETTTRDKATLFISSTVSILTATSLNTSHKRITLKSRRTSTDWSVIIYITNCSISTSCC